MEALLWIVASSRNLLKFNTKVLLSVATIGIIKLLSQVWNEGR